ncbi:hypothetical protein BH09VER1_BH09VER1_23140 [soil metagenome]
MKTKSSSRRAAALIVVLSVVVLATILVVGLTVAMRLDRSASFYHLERTRAEFLARVGLDQGRALLLDATATNRFWISGPGRIRASQTNSFGAPTNLIGLSSGYTNDTNADVSADLNRQALDTGDRLLNPGGTNFNFQWVYVQTDGSYTNVKNTNSVGRFAFWVDDESSRVDLNTAGTRSTPLTASPGQVSLGALPGLAPYAAAITAEASTNPFTTPLEILGRNAGWTNALVTNRFYLTHYTQDPDVDPWGQPRTVLTTRLGNASGRPFLNILGATNVDPGLYTGLSAGQLQTNYAAISSNLTRTNWPYAPGGSFVAKYGPSGVSQLALDIIEYVRTAESTNLWIDPIVATATTNSLALLPASTALSGIPSGAYIGTVRRPMLSQVGVFCSTNTNAAGTGFLGTVHVETWLPPAYSAGAGPFNGWTLWAEVASSSGSMTNTVSQPLSALVYTNGYATGSLTNVDIPAGVVSGIPTNTMVRVALLKSPTSTITNILDLAPLREADFINCSTATNITAYSAVNDPRVNKYGTNWSAYTNLTGDVGPATQPVNYSVFAGTPPSDGSTNSVVMKATNSIVGSVGELGFVATGISSGTSAPWRSLRLQTNSSSSTNIPPDWALLDLFSAPVAARYVPGTNVIAGRVNLNVVIPEGTNLSRTNVLNALFTNVPFVAPSTLTSVVSNVATVQLASGGLDFGQLSSSTNLVSVGELSEIAGLGDRGEAGEEAIRQVASLATVRGDVFGIYSFGQAIRVSSSGRVTVNGEKILHAMVERYFDSAGEAKFRIISWSEIYP